MTFEFEVYGSQNNGGEKKSNVDWDAYHQYIVETAGIQEREVMPGVITFMADLGVQKVPDAQFEFTGTEEDEEEEIKKNPGTYFIAEKNYQTGKMERLKCYPQKPVQAVALAVDFPDIQLDYGQFFGDTSGTTKPLRMWLGGTFYLDGTGMVVARPTYLKANKKLGAWSFDQKALPYKIAVASKIIKPGEVFDTKRIGELLGKTANWTVQVHMKESKGKEYFTEYIQFASGLSRGQSEIDYEGEIHATMFNRENDPIALKELRSHVKNTMKQAANYEGSKIQAQLEKIEAAHKSNKSSDEGADKPEQEEKKIEKKVTSKPKPTPKVPRTLDEDLDEDTCPF